MSLTRRAADSSTFTAGIHLPQAGPAASAESITAVAAYAEERGYAGVWVSDHLVVQQGAAYPPSAYILDPLVTMTWAAAVTRTVSLGSSVLVVPMRRPVVLGKMLASLDVMSGGRVIAGVGAGWADWEYATLGVDFDRRGRLTDEAIAVMRAIWTEDPIDGHYPEHDISFERIRAKPQPAESIPVWVGGRSRPALRRTTELGDGWNDIVYGVDIEACQKAARTATQLRAARPEPGFVLSIRVSWDGLADDADGMLRCLDVLRDGGFSHVLAEPRQRTGEDYLRSTEALADVFERAGALSPAPEAPATTGRRSGRAGRASNTDPAATGP